MISTPFYGSAAEIAARLHALADQLAAVAADADLPEFHVTLSLQPRGSEDVTVPAIDAVGLALFGRPGATVAMSGGGFHHEASAEPEGGVSVSAFTSVTPPHLRAEKEKVARLERELADARAKLAQAGAPGPDQAEAHDALDEPERQARLAQDRAEADSDIGGAYMPCGCRVDEGHDASCPEFAGAPHVRQRTERFRGNGFYARKPGVARTLCGAEATTLDLSFGDARRAAGQVEVCSDCAARLARDGSEGVSAQ